MKRYAIQALVVLLVIYFAGLPSSAWNNQMGPWAAGALPAWMLLSIALPLAAALVLLPLRRLRVSPYSAIVPLAVLICGQCICLRAAWPVAIGKMAQGIDHPAFLFRLREFFTAFPALGSYNPWWNAGTEHFIGVTSGAHGFAFLLSPFLLFAPLETAYSAALLFWMAVGFPWLTVFALRRAGLRLAAAAAGGLMMLAFTRAEFLFFWQSGNLGGMVAAMLAPSIAAIAYRIAVQRRGTWLDTALLAAMAWLSCIWTPGVFTCAGLFLGWLCFAKRWTRPSLAQMAVAGAATLLLLLPWLWTTFFPARGIVNYVAGGSGLPGESAPHMLAVGLGQLARRIREWHPLIAILGIGGTLFALRKPMRKWMAPLFVLLCAVTVAIGFKRTSQLDRVAIQLAAALVFPAAAVFSHIVRAVGNARGPRKIMPALFLTVATAFLLLGSVIADLHYAGKSDFKLWPAQDPVYDFANWIHENVPAGGRLAFSGVTDCKFEWGKPTYLPVLSGREMMSDDYYGYPKGLTERNYPPKYYRKSDERFMRFSDAYGITHWVVTDSHGKTFFDGHPEFFELADYRTQQSTHIYTYRRVNQPEPTRCLIGKANVSAWENRIVVTPDGRQDEIVIRYNWRPGLRCKTKGAEIHPYDVDGNIKFIAVRPGGNNSVVIGYRPTWHPLLPNFDGTFHH